MSSWHRTDVGRLGLLIVCAYLLFLASFLPSVNNRAVATAPVGPDGEHHGSSKQSQAIHTAHPELAAKNVTAVHNNDEPLTAVLHTVEPRIDLVPGTEFGLPANFSVLTHATSTSFPRHAYVLVLSNEVFLDGALVMGASLRANSEALRSREMHLCIIVTAGRLCNASLMRLVDNGFDVVVQVPSLAVYAPGAAFKDTFDKSYMFRLTCYEKIVFMDADMIAVRSPDALFQKPTGLTERSVGAIGFRGGKRGEDYFQTGMMVVHPSEPVFADIMREFFRNVPPKGRKYNQGMSGRDGVLLRTIFSSRFKEIDNRYSRNLNPRYPIPENVICVHLRGKHKPWFDWHGPVADPELGKKEFGFAYIEWWRVYEAIHLASPEYRAAKAGAIVPGYGGAAAAQDVSPLTHVWMMRYSKKEYVQLLSSVDRKMRDVRPDDLALTVGAKGESCDQVCKMSGKRCDAAQFNNTPVQSCEELQSAFKCDTCQLAVYWRPHPGNDFPGLDMAKGKPLCRWNLMRDQRSVSTCSGRNETTKRLCPCVG